MFVTAQSNQYFRSFCAISETNLLLFLVQILRIDGQMSEIFANSFIIPSFIAFLRDHEFVSKQKSFIRLQSIEKNEQKISPKYLWLNYKYKTN